MPRYSDPGRRARPPISVGQAILASPKTECSTQYPRTVHLKITNEVFYHCIANVPRGVPMLRQPYHKFSFASHRIIGPLRTNCRVKTKASVKDFGAHCHVGPEY